MANYRCVFASYGRGKYICCSKSKPRNDLLTSEPVESEENLYGGGGGGNGGAASATAASTRPPWVPPPPRPVQRPWSAPQPLVVSGTALGSGGGGGNGDNSRWGSATWPQQSSGNNWANYGAGATTNYGNSNYGGTNGVYGGGGGVSSYGANTGGGWTPNTNWPNGASWGNNVQQPTNWGYNGYGYGNAAATRNGGWSGASQWPQQQATTWGNGGGYGSVYGPNGGYTPFAQHRRRIRPNSKLYGTRSSLSRRPWSYMRQWPAAERSTRKQTRVPPPPLPLPSPPRINFEPAHHPGYVAALQLNDSSSSSTSTSSSSPSPSPANAIEGGGSSLLRSLKGAVSIRASSSPPLNAAWPHAARVLVYWCVCKIVRPKKSQASSWKRAAKID